jgi:predicted ATPase
MASPEASEAYLRARELCRGIPEGPQLVAALYGLRSALLNRRNTPGVGHEAGDRRRDQKVPYYLGLLAEAHRRIDRTTEGLNLLSEALEIVERTDERWYEAELYRLNGDLLFARTDRQSAEPWFSRALATAQKQGAKSWEIRASTSLARLRRDQGKRTEARDLLAPVYGWFTEGFDTPVLKEAKALLEELS